MTAGRFSAVVEDQVARVTDELGGGGGGGDGDHAGEHAFNMRKKHDPKKRIVMLTAFLACLSVIVIILNGFFSFTYDIVREDDFWKRVNQIIERVKTNQCKCD